MKCSNCGIELPEGAVFCVGCGQKVESTQPVVEMQETVAQTAVETVIETPQKKHGLLVAGIIGLIVALLIAAAILAMNLFTSGHSGGNEKQMVYQKDGVLYFVPNMDKDKDPIEIDEMRGENVWSYQFSDSGKYLYYKSTEDRSVLSRAEVGKLKADSSRNSKYIVEIDSKVDAYELIDDERLCYKDTSGRLYYYDGKEETEIDRDVAGFMMSSGSKMYYAVWRDGSYDYYYYDINKDEGDCFAKDVQLVNADWDKGIIYAQDEDEIYQISADGEEKTILEDVEELKSVSAVNQRVYFLRTRIETHKLYDFVDDPYASEDAGIREPVITDYLSKVSESQALSEDDWEYYAEYPEEKEDDLNWNSELGMGFYNNWDDNRTYYYESGTKQWFSCDWDAFYADRDAYQSVEARINIREALKQENYEQTYHDLYVWDATDGEQLLVESVKPFSVLIDNDHQALIYQKAETDEGQTKKISIDDVYDTYAVSDMLESADDYEEDYDYYEEVPAAEEPAAEEPADDATAEEPAATQETGRQTQHCYAMVGGKECELDILVKNMQVSPDGKTAMLFDAEEPVVYSYEIASDGLKSIGKVGEDIQRSSWVDDCFYFTSGTDEYGDLSVYKDGKEKVLVKNVYLYQIGVYDDGNTCAYKDAEKKDLRIFNDKGEDIKVASDVESYQYIHEKRIVYLKNDNLYVYTGKDEDRRIVRNLGEYGDYLCFSKEIIF